MVESRAAAVALEAITQSSTNESRLGAIALEAVVQNTVRPESRLAATALELVTGFPTNNLRAETVPYSTEDNYSPSG